MQRSVEKPVNFRGVVVWVMGFTSLHVLRWLASTVRMRARSGLPCMSFSPARPRGGSRQSLRDRR